MNTSVLVQLANAIQLLDNQKVDIAEFSGVLKHVDIVLMDNNGISKHFCFEADNGGSDIVDKLHDIISAKIEENRSEIAEIVSNKNKRSVT